MCKNSRYLAKKSVFRLVWWISISSNLICSNAAKKRENSREDKGVARIGPQH
jgi:hypothetical protein